MQEWVADPVYSISLPRWYRYLFYGPVRNSVVKKKSYGTIESRMKTFERIVEKLEAKLYNTTEKLVTEATTRP